MSTKTLTEAETLSLAQLKVKDRAGLLTDTDERLRYKALQANPPTPDRELSLGGRVVTGHGYREMGANALKATDRSGLMLDDDVTLAQVGPTGTKTLLRVGVATSAGAFQSIDDQGATYAPTRRPLELLDLVRAGTTTEGSISHVRQGSYTGVAVETAEPSGVTVGTKPEATIPFEVVASPVEPSRCGPQQRAELWLTWTSSRT
jgi:hypothetical protein